MIHAIDRTHDKRFQHPLAKCCAIILKYRTLESTVDGFMYPLLFYLGFFEEWLYVFPQYEMELVYGGDLTSQ